MEIATLVVMEFAYTAGACRREAALEAVGQPRVEEMLTLPDERQHMRVDLVGPVPVVKGLDARHEVGEIVPAKRPLAVSNRPDQLSVALCVQAHDPHEPRWHPPEPTT